MMTIEELYENLKVQMEINKEEIKKNWDKK